jgi:hypothetical protein
MQQLSGELFSQISAQLRAAGATGQDKRKTPRVGFRSQVSMTPQTDGTIAAKSTRVMVRDLSPTGISILLHYPLFPNSLFAVELPVFTGGELVAVYQVKHCNPLEKDLYRIGAALVRVRQPDEIKPGEKAA